MSGSLVVFDENYTIFICWLYQCKTLLILVQIIAILWIKCWPCFTVGGHQHFMLLLASDGATSMMGVHSGINTQLKDLCQEVISGDSILIT